MRRVALAIVAAAAFVAGPAAPAEAHTLGPRFVSILDGISPPRAAVHVSLRSTNSAPVLTVRVDDGVFRVTVQGRTIVATPAKAAVFKDSRGEWPLSEAPAAVLHRNVRATIYRWAIPASYNDGPAQLRGHVDWLPAGFHVEYYLAGGITAACALVYAVGRRRGPGRFEPDLTAPDGSIS